MKQNSKIPGDDDEAASIADKVERKTSADYSAVKSKVTSVIMAAVFLAAIIATSWNGIGDLKTRSIESACDFLAITAETVHEFLYSWYDREARRLTARSNAAPFVEYVKNLLACPRTPEALRACANDGGSKEFSIDEYFSEFDGFSIVAPDMRVVGSTRKKVLGKRSPIADWRPELLRSAFEGETDFFAMIVPPEEDFLHRKDPNPVVFIASPVKDVERKTIAAVVSRLYTSHLVERVQRLARLGPSGKVYMFDENGRIFPLSGPRHAASVDVAKTTPEDEIGADEGLNHRRPPGNSALSRLALKAAAGGRGVEVEVYLDGRGTRIFGALAWDERLHAGIAVETGEKEALASHYENRRLIVGILALTICLTFLLIVHVFKRGERTRHALKKARDDWERIAEEKNAELRKRALDLEESNQELIKSRAAALNLMQDAHEQRERAESVAAKLVESRARMKEIERRRQVVFEKSPSGIMYIGADGEIVECNDILEEILGVKQERIVGRDVRDEPFPEDMRKAFEKALGGQPAKFEGHCASVFGARSIGCLRVRFNPITPGSSPSEVIATLEDVSEQKRADEKIAGERRQLLKILDASPVGVVITAGEVIRFANPGFVDMSDLAVGDDPRTAYVNPEDRDYMLKEINKKGIIRDFEFKAYNRDRKIVDVMATFVRTEYEGEKGVIGWLSDITDFKRIQNELIAAKESAEEAARAKSRFLANMSHEIRTPLNAVIGMAYLALKTDLTAKQRDYLEKINQSAKSLLGLVNDILDFSKIEAGRMKLESVNFDLSETLRSVVDMESFKAVEKGLQLSVKTSPGVPMAVEGDPLRLRQVLNNLVSNAIKFTESGEVVVGVRSIERDRGEEVLEFSVRDTGVGMTREQMLNVFESFSQAESSTTRKFGGSGLGLAICRNLVDMMGGEIWAESQPGRGSVFFFTARFGNVKPPEKEKPEVSPGIRGLKILVADDEGFMRKLLARILTKLNFKVETCDSGSKAVQLVKEFADSDPFRLVIVDWMMPGMDGMEAARKIKTDPDLAVVPKIFVLTGYIREEFEEKLQWSQADGFLMKPVSKSLLFDKIADEFADAAEMARQARQKLSDNSEVLNRIRGARVLVAEDNEINRQFALELLEMGGLIVETASDGAQAVRMVEEGRYDAILMDIQMPELDGYEATRKIRNFGNADDPCLTEKADIPVIAMTAHALPSDFDKSREAGMDDHITKPLDPQKLFFALAGQIGSKPRSDIREKNEERRDVAKEVEFKDDVDKTLPDHLEHIDLKTVSAKLGGNQAAVKKLLAKFADLQRGTAENIAAAARQGEMETAIRLSHNLKGVAGNIGAMKLFEIAGDLEYALRSGQDGLEDLIESTTLALKQVISSIDSLGPNRKTDAEEAGDEDGCLSEALPLLEELKKLLEENDMDAVAKLGEIKEHLTGPAFFEEIEAIDKSLARYDAEKALGCLGRLMDDISKNRNLHPPGDIHGKRT